MAKTGNVVYLDKWLGKKRLNKWLDILNDTSCNRCSHSIHASYSEADGAIECRCDNCNYVERYLWED